MTFPPPDLDTVGEADVLFIGWGSTWGAITAATERLRESGLGVDHIHLTHLNPFPRQLGEMISGYKHILVPELNKGQLVRLLRAEYLVDAQAISKVEGLPFTAPEIIAALEAHLGKSVADDGVQS